MRWTAYVVLLFLAALSHEAQGFDGPECLWTNFMCSEGNCAYNSWVCDGNRDCSNGKDEERCGGCDKQYFACNNGTCIHNYNICNGKNDCSEGEDESSCGKICYDTEHECADGQCISGHNITCNGKMDCRDGSDELHCEVQPKCINNDFSCYNGTCINRHFVCDGDIDCSKGEDEMNCTYSATCGRDQVACSDNKCAPSLLQCFTNPVEISAKESKDEKTKKSEQCLLVHGCIPKIIGLVFGVLGLVLIIAGWSFWFYRERVAQAGESNYRRLGRETEGNPASEAITMDDVP